MSLKTKTPAILAAIVAGTLSVQAIRECAEYKGAMRRHRRLYPACTNIVLSGCTHTGWVVNVHHKVGLAECVWMGWDPTNLETLCDHENAANRARTGGCHYNRHEGRW